MKPRKIGAVAANKIPIYHDGVLRGAVTPAATSITVARFTGHHGAKLGKHKGRTAWISNEPLADVSASGTTAGAPRNETRNRRHLHASRARLREGSALAGHPK